MRDAKEIESWLIEKTSIGWVGVELTIEPAQLEELKPIMTVLTGEVIGPQQIYWRAYACHLCPGKLHLGIVKAALENPVNGTIVFDGRNP